MEKITSFDQYKNMKQEVLEKIDFKAYLEDEGIIVKGGRDPQVHGLCIFHNDKNPSFSFNTESKAWLCHAGCGKGDIFDFHMKKYNVDFITALTAIFDYCNSNVATQTTVSQESTEKHTSARPASKSRFLKAYEYKDENGKVIHATLLYDYPKESGQRFKQAVPDEKGWWTLGLNDVATVPYNLSEVIRYNVVYIVEGEKDAETLINMGLPGTTCPFGAGKWKEHYNQYFKNKHIVIIPDNDEPGANHARSLIQNLKHVAISIKVIKLPELQEKGDITDWCFAKSQKGQSTDDIIKEFGEIVTSTKEVSGVGYKNGYSLFFKEFKSIDWIIPGIMPEGLTLLSGKPKIGKSWLALDIAIACATGGEVFLREVLQRPVYYLSLEDNERRLQKRMEIIMGSSVDIDLKQYLFYDTEINRHSTINRIEHWATIHGKNGLVIIDTFGKVRVNKGDKYQDDVAELTAFLDLVNKYDISVLLIHHLKKSEAEDVHDMAYGTLGVVGSVDSSIILTKARGTIDGILHTTGRDIEEELELALSFEKETCRWKIIGDAKDVAMSKERREIMDLLMESGEPLNCKTLAELTERNQGSVNKMLFMMEKEGQVIKTKRGQYTIAQ